MKRALDAWNEVGTAEEELPRTETTWPQSRQGRVTMAFDLAHHARPADVQETPKHITLWIPYPGSDEHQRISDVAIEGDFDSSGVYFDRLYKTPILHAKWTVDSADKEKKYYLNLSLHVARSRVVAEKSLPTAGFEERPWNEVDLDLFLRSTSLAPIEGNVVKTANLVAGDSKSVVEKAHKIYNWVVENTYRDAGIVGCGDGDVCAMLSKKLGEIGGKCTDIGSLFIAICRAAKVPCREVFGIRLGKTFGESVISGWQHCWCEFFVPGHGWVPVDPSDVRLKMLTENLPLKGSKKYNLVVFQPRVCYLCPVILTPVW